MEKEIVTIEDIKININTSNISENLKKYFLNKRYEYKEFNILKQVLSPSDCILELGAGIGFIGAYCAKRIGENKVFLIEANPLLKKDIEETFTLNYLSPNVIIGIASCENNKEKEFFVEKDFWSSSTIRRSEDSYKIINNSVNVNNLIKEHHINFLVIDIEGGEKDIIPCLDFSLINKIMIEFHPDIIGDLEISSLINIILDKGFVFDLFKSNTNVCFFYKK